MTVYDKKSRLVVYKGGKCFDCGRIFPQCCYDFDHRDPNQKSFGISQRMGLPLEELMIEADKCDLVCSNCHRIRTAGNPAISQKITKAQQADPLGIEERNVLKFLGICRVILTVKVTQES